MVEKSPLISSVPLLLWYSPALVTLLGPLGPQVLVATHWRVLNAVMLLAANWREPASVNSVVSALAAVPAPLPQPMKNVVTVIVAFISCVSHAVPQSQKTVAINYFSFIVNVVPAAGFGTVDSHLDFYCGFAFSWVHA